MAEPLYAETLEIYRRDTATKPVDLANAIRGLVLIKEEVGEQEEAIRFWQEARKLYAEVEVRAGVKESAKGIEALVRGEPHP